MLRRFFCGVPTQDAEGDWVVSRSTMLQTQALYAKSRALDVIENDIDYHFQGLRLRQQVLDPTSMKRVHRANLPVEDSQRVTDILGKIAAVARSSKEMKEKCSKMHVALEKVQEDARIAEFAKERAEALATARGQALMKSQNALRDAEEQQVQLSELLRSALEQLGVHSPEKRSSIENRITSPAVAQYVKSTDSGHTRSRFQSTNIETTPPSAGLLGPSGPSEPLGRLSGPSPQHMRDFSPSPGIQASHETPLSGFTVYSNALSEDVSPGLYDQHGHQYGADEIGWKENTRGYNLGTPSTAAATPAAYESKPDEVGPRTAERLARMVLPHLDPEQIDSLVRYQGESDSPRIRKQGKSPMVPTIQEEEEEGCEGGGNAPGERVQSSQSTDSTAQDRPGSQEGRSSRTSIFKIESYHHEVPRDAVSSQESTELIKACRDDVRYDAAPYHDGPTDRQTSNTRDLNDVERKRRAAQRVMQKLNSKLPAELRRSTLVELSRG